MKIIRATCWRGISLLAVSILLLGCNTSLHPLYTDKDLVFEKSLVGAWSDSDGNSKWTFSKDSEKRYKLVIRHKEKSSPFEAHLFKLQDQLLLDMVADPSGFENTHLEEYYQISMIPTHHFFKIELTENSLKLYLLQDDWLKELFQKEPKAISHTIIQEDRILFTASTAEMQKFLIGHLKTEKAWSDPGVLERSPKPPE